MIFSHYLTAASFGGAVTSAIGGILAIVDGDFYGTMILALTLSACAWCFIEGLSFARDGAPLEAIVVERE